MNRRNIITTILIGALNWSLTADQGARSPTTTTPTGESLNKYYEDFAPSATLAIAFRSRSDLDIYRFGGTAKNYNYTDYNTSIDMMRVVTPAFLPSKAQDASFDHGFLDGAIDASQTTLKLNDDFGGNPNDSLKCGDEIIRFRDYDRSGNFTGLTRGYGGTKATAHADGTVCVRSGNGLVTGVRPSFAGTSDGRTYMWHWQEVLGAGYVNVNGIDGMKQHQLGNPNLFIEPRWNLNDYTESSHNARCFVAGTTAAAINIRSYNAAYDNNPAWSGGSPSRAGPNTVGNGNGQNFQGNGILLPIANDKCVLPLKVCRHWITIEQIANDWDPLNYWVRCEGDSGATQIYDDIQISVDRPISGWWWEGLNSDSAFKPPPARAAADLISCFSNFMMFTFVGNRASSPWNDTAMTANHLSRAVPGTASPCR